MWTKRVAHPLTQVVVKKMWSWHNNVHFQEAVYLTRRLSSARAEKKPFKMIYDQAPQKGSVERVGVEVVFMPMPIGRPLLDSRSQIMNNSEEAKMKRDKRYHQRSWLRKY